MQLRGLSDARLASKTGLNRTTIYRIRTGRVRPELATSTRIAAELDLPLTDLVEVPQ